MVCLACLTQFDLSNQCDLSDWSDLSDPSNLSDPSDLSSLSNPSDLSDLSDSSVWPVRPVSFIQHIHVAWVLLVGRIVCHRSCISIYTEAMPLLYTQTRHLLTNLSLIGWKGKEMRVFSQQRILHLMSELIPIQDRYEVLQHC